MKHVYATILTLFVSLFLISAVQAQNEVQQRIERYLYTNYNTNKGSIRENERIIRMLEERLDAYLVGLDKETQRVATTQEKEVKQLLQQINKIHDPKVLKKMIEDTHTKNVANLDRFVNKGLSAPQDALECRRIIVMKLVELDLLHQKQEKLLALLKDDHSRSQFIAGMLKNIQIQESSDLKIFAQAIDGEVDKFIL